MNPNGFYEIFVKGIYQGSPADRSGVITEGDTLLEVNGENVRGLSLQQVAPLITGPLNTPVQLGFKPGKEAREAGLVQCRPLHRFSLASICEYVSSCLNLRRTHPHDALCGCRGSRAPAPDPERGCDVSL